MQVGDPMVVVTSILVVLLSIALHEFAHAKTADASGDPTPRMQGRVTLNPLAHLDPLGTIMIIVTSLTGFGFGWGRPVMVDPRKMRNPRWDHFLSVAAGPATNLLLAAICAIILRVMVTPRTILEMRYVDLMSAGALPAFFLVAVFVNSALCLFNLIPVGPLDGHWMVGTFMPEPMRYKWYAFNRGPGSLIFLILVLMPNDSPLDIFGHVLRPAVDKATGFFLGL